VPGCLLALSTSTIKSHGIIASSRTSIIEISRTTAFGGEVFLDDRGEVVARKKVARRMFGVSSQASTPVLSESKPAPALITGAASFETWATKSV
jgi:hypothetical protein